VNDGILSAAAREESRIPRRITSFLAQISHLGFRDSISFIFCRRVMRFTFEDFCDIDQAMAREKGSILGTAFASWMLIDGANRAGLI
jgi:hypothetical protein